MYLIITIINNWVLDFSVPTNQNSHTVHKYLCHTRGGTMFGSGPLCISSVHVPVLCEHIHRTRMVGAVTDIQSFHLWHEVEEKAPDLLLNFWKPENKKIMKKAQWKYSAAQRKKPTLEENVYIKENSEISAVVLKRNTGCLPAYYKTVDSVVASAVVMWAGTHSLGALLQWLDEHLLECADLLQVPQDQSHIWAAESNDNNVKWWLWEQWHEPQMWSWLVCRKLLLVNVLKWS